MNLPTRIPTTPPLIPPPEEGAGNQRPLWSVMIPAYNCGPYLKETLQSVLAQDPGEALMQIEVCDDASTDTDVARLVQETGKGRVGYYPQHFNVGSLRNFETALKRSRGSLVHLLHGDDRVKTGFYKKMGNFFDDHPEAGAAFCRYVSVDEWNGEEMISELEQSGTGILDDWLKRLSVKQRIQTPAMVVRRAVYEDLGAFYGVHYGEDWEMWLRIAAHYKTGYVPEVLAEYRKHDDSISGKYILTGQNIRDLKTVMDLSRDYFTPDQWRQQHRESRNFYAHYAINTARKIWGRHHHRRGTIRQIREAFSLAIDREILLQSAKLLAKIALGIKK